MRGNNNLIIYVPFNRWGNTPLDEGRMCGNKNLIKLLEDAKAAQLSDFPYPSREITGLDQKLPPKIKIKKKKKKTF